MAGTFAFAGDEAVGAYVVEQLEARGLVRVEDAAEADVALTYCLTGSLLEDVYFEQDGLVKRAGAGTVLIDLSPSTPALVREMSAIATVNDLVFVEAPLAVDDSAAAFPSFGNLTCFAACEEEIPADVRDLLGCLAAKVVPCKAVGDAQLAKASRTVRMAAQVVSTVEASALERSVRGSLEPDSDASALDAAIAAGEFDRGYPIAHLMTDVVAAMATADDVELILPQLEAAMHLMELMAVIGGADRGPAALSLLYREEAEGAAQGLDWTRAEGLYDVRLAESDDSFDDDAFDYDYAGGFGGYSEN